MIRPLGRDIALALMLKLALLSLLYAVFFRPGLRPAVDANAAARHLLASAPDAAPVERAP